jgi:Domain of unknown function (DUF4491)
MLQLTGVWIGLVTFVSIWWGHVGVRWIEAHSRRIWPPLVALLLAALGLNLYALFAPNLAIGGACSVVGFTVFWDAVEVYRQQWRVIHGHAPANPRNSRHVAYLAAGLGRADDPLKREPQGVPVDALHTAQLCNPCVGAPCLVCPRRKGNQKITRRQEAHAAMMSQVTQVAEVEQ